MCSTRPRRFGKTFAAEARVAYYTCGADSRGLFEGLDISRDPSCVRLWHRTTTYRDVRWLLTATIPLSRE